jgi:hypothetical protein
MLYHPMFWIGLSLVCLQSAVCYDQGEVSRDRLGSLGRRR